MDPISGHYAEGTVNFWRGKNMLQMTLMTKSADGSRAPVLRASEAVDQIVREFRDRGIEIDGFLAHWNDSLKEYGGKPSDNFVGFAKAYNDALLERRGSLNLPAIAKEVGFYEMNLFQNRQRASTPEMLQAKEDILHALETAVWKTWTGKKMATLGFDHIREIRVINAVGKTGLDGSNEGSLEVYVSWEKKNENSRPAEIVDDQTISNGRPYDGSSLPRLHKIVQHLSASGE
ncbi:MAG: hypothetical protein V4736_06195 [Bdellovibrionota bacterium]